jgi:hypothetical protein
LSNKLIRLARRVTTLSIGGESRAIWPSEKAVLTCLADDARDKNGGKARLGAGEIALRTGINRRTVEVAIRRLCEAGIISREGGGGRATAQTILHLETVLTPESDSGVPRIHTGGAPNPHRGCPESDSGVESTRVPIDHSTSAGAAPRERVSAERVMAEAAGGGGADADPVDHVFDAWDAMARAKGLPGPVKRDIERRATVERRIAAEKLWRVLAAVRAVGDAPYLTNRKARHDGQGDVMADFDFVFGVGHLRGNRVFERLLEGSFTGGRAIPLEEFRTPPAETGPPPPLHHRDEADEFLRLRAAMRASLGAHHYDAWIAPLRFERQAGGLVATAPSAFVADWVTGHYLDQLRGAAGGVAVRIMVREKV